MKRSLLALIFAAMLAMGLATPATAGPSESAAIVTHDCVAENVGIATVIVHGEVVATQQVPADQSSGLGPCKVPPGQVL